MAVGDNTNVSGILGELQDIEEKYRALVETTDTGYVILDGQGRVLDANAEYVRLTGRKGLGDILGRPVTAWTAPHDQARNAEEVGKCLETGRARGLEIDYVSPEGTLTPIEINATVVRTSEGPRILTLCKDITERRRTESALREMESLFQAFLEHSPVYVFFKDAELRPIWLSRNFEEMLGRPLDQALGRTMDELFPPELAAGMIADDRRIIEQGELVKVDEDLGDRSYTTIKFPVVLEGKPPCLAGFTIDITDRKRAMEAMQQSEARFRAIFEQASVGMVEVSTEGRFLTANQAFQDFLGYSEPELQGLGLQQVTHPAFRELDRQRIRAVLSREIPFFATEKIYLRKDGSEVWGRVHATLLRDGSGRPVNLIAIVEDIDERKRAEEALASSELRFRSLFESMIEGVALHDLVYEPHGTAVDYRIIDVSPAFARHTGLKREAVVGRLASELYGAGTPPFLDTYAQVAASGKPCVFEEYFAPMGKHFRISVFSPRQASFATIFEDITEQKRNEEERRRLEAEVQHAQKLESLGVLAGGVAHDMNNVLQAIQGMASVLRAKLAGDVALVSGLDIILNASNRGRDLVKNLTDFARKGLQGPQPLDLNQLVRTEVELLQHTTLQRIELRMELGSGLPRILGDPSALSNALMNLCVNALDAMPDKGVLSFRSRMLADGSVTLEIEDSGEGMAPEVLARATEPFFTTKPIGKGTGLGLSGVYGTMKAHGGSMEIHSEPGKGTTVTLRFPACQEPPEPAPSPVPEPSREPEACLRILLVDDDELIRDSFPDLMNILGHTVVRTASSGSEALGHLEDGLEVDAVVLDQNMPGLSGLETLERLRLSHPALPVILCTGHLDEDARERMRAIPHVRTLLKPYSIKDIRPLLADLAREKG